MIYPGDLDKFAAMLRAEGMTVHSPDDLGETRWTDPPAVPEEDEHDEFPCILCGGVVRWRYGDYYCQKCGTTYEIDGRICKEGAK